MNKYSSKAVKTAATIGMSLAMVLSNAAPLFAADPVNTVCKTEDTNVAKDLLNAIKADIKAANLKLSTISVDKEITWTNTAVLLGSTAPNEKKATLEALLGITPENGEGTVVEYMTTLANCEETTDAIYLAGDKDDDDRLTILEKVAAIESAIEYLEDQFADDADLDGADLTEREYNTVKPYYDDLTAYYADYKNNMSEADKAGNKEIYDELFSRMETAVEDYEDSYIGDFVDSYVDALKGAEVIEDVTVAMLVDKDAEFARTNLSDLEDFIKDLKADKVDELKDEVKYSKVADEEDVAKYVDRLEEMVEEIKEVNAMLKTSNTVIKDYKKIATKVGELATEAAKYDEDDTDAYDKKFNALRSADIEKLKTYVEEVVENFYTVETVKRTNGNYSLRLKDADYARYLENETDVVSAALKTLLTTNIEKDSDESVYDALVGQTTDIDTLLKAVTTDIEGITLGTTLTDKQAAKIVAAKKAYDKLMDTDGEFYSALTSKEKKAVEANETLITTLYYKLILNGTVTQSGWVDKGNGDWDYIAEDGSRPSKWVASGANWYYVKNGTMLRNSWIASDAQGTRWYYVDDNGVMVSNTTVNGYTFNSYGVWVK
ncbi:hypothetical protein DES51_1271 [Dielma fastidiosa]|uniref:Cell wall binding repeat protein n=1 Tax=Dielma fastidiosa TaxID=1034346 RepID=A0A318KQY1_9FIRM|nr:hypothetical protein [Dielma fastidiosa]PXX74043.1 hypothetical protein DES51_1271 [Dielma fastidiosa]